MQAPAGRFRSLAALVRPALELLSIAALAACSEPPTEFGIAVDFDLETLDPHAENTYGNIVVLSNVYEPLVALDAEMRVRPALATSWETPDPLTWVFRLRPSVRFHGGETLSSADVVYSIQRVLDGTDLEMRTYLGNVAEVGARGEDTVVVRTKRPHALLPGHLSFIQIVPRGSSAEDLKVRPNGTGPYAVETWVPRERVLLRRHGEHWGTPAALERVAFELNRSPEEAITGIENGRYQRVAEINDPGLEEAARRTGQHDILHRDNLYVRYLGFDVQRDETPFCKSIPNPFKQKAVREAIHLALDREALASLRQSRAVPASQFVPRTVFGFDPEIPMPTFDPDRARELLREAGLGAGFDVVLHCLDGVLEQPARAISEQLGRVGIRVTVSVLSDTEFFAALNNREVSFWLLATGCATGDATELFESSFHSPDAQDGFGIDNYGDYRNPDLDRAIQAAAALASPRARQRALQRLMRTVMEELPWVPLYYEDAMYVVDSDFEFSPRNDLQVRAADIRPRP